MNTNTSTSMRVPSERAARRVNRDLWEQIQIVRQYNNDTAGNVVNVTAQLFDPEELRQKLAWAEGLAGEGGKMVMRRLKRAEALGSQRSLSPVPNASALADLDQRFPNFAEVTALVRNHCALCGLAPADGLRLPPILLSGPAGVGKTAYALALSRALSVTMKHVDVGSLVAEHALVGLDFGYESAKPGAVFEALDHDSMSPLVLLDEIDKPPRSAGVLGGLYRLLEQHSAKSFEDAAVPLTVDASRIHWMATCNDPSMIEPALLSRFELIEVERPSESQISAVIESIQGELIANQAWSKCFDHTLSETVRSQLATSTPREIRRSLQAAYAAAANSGRRHLTAADLPTTVRVRKQSLGFTNS